MAFSARDFFTAFATAINSHDAGAVRAMMHPDFSTSMPQTGERSHGFELFWAQVEAYPGGGPGVPALPATRIIGDDERWAITPAFTVVPLAQPNQFTMLASAVYPDGSRWFAVAFVELRDELVHRMEFYFAPELAAPLSQSIASFGRG